jgi:hypothetical protein
MSSNMISQAQFQKLADKINLGGGFSHKVAGAVGGPLGRGERAKHGYMVGMPGYGKDFPVDQPVTGAELEQHAMGHQSILSDPDVFMGGWQGKDPTRASVDASVRFDRSASGLVNAREAATLANQEAIGEVGFRGGYVGETLNPYYRSERGHQQRIDPTLFEYEWEQTGSADPVAVGALAAGDPIKQPKTGKAWPTQEAMQEAYIKAQLNPPPPKKPKKQIAGQTQLAV